MDIRVHTVWSQGGLFSMLDTLLSTIAQSERDGIPTYVDWSNAKNYLDEPGNLFDHLFEQPFGITAEELPKHRIIETVIQSNPYWKAMYQSRNWYVLDQRRIAEASRLLQRYIVVKSYIRDAAEAFFQQHLSSRTLGIHIRGTDMQRMTFLGHSSTPLLSSYKSTIEREMKRGIYTHIFCASDDQPLLDSLITMLKESNAIPTTTRIVTYEARRASSNTPIHQDKNISSNKLKSAQDVLIECLILARCSFLIKSRSNVSSFAVFFNPSLPLFDLNTLPLERLRNILAWPVRWVSTHFHRLHAHLSRFKRF